MIACMLVECVGLGWRGLDQQWVLPQAIAQRTFLGTFSISSHPSSTYPIAPGDIEVFKNMELTSLELSYCNQLTGVFGRGQGMVGGVKIGNRLRPQGLA